MRGLTAAEMMRPSSSSSSSSFNSCFNKKKVFWNWCPPALRSPALFSTQPRMKHDFFREGNKIQSETSKTSHKFTKKSRRRKEKQKVSSIKSLSVFLSFFTFLLSFLISPFFLFFFYLRVEVTNVHSI